MSNSIILAHEPCVSCFKGDTDTVVGFAFSEKSDLTTALWTLGLPLDEAKVTADESKPYMNNDSDESLYVIRVCATCASKPGYRVAKIGKEQLVIYSK